MALKDLLALIDDKLHDVYHKVVYSADKDRAAMVARVKDTKAKFLATEQPRGRKDYSIANGVVAYSPMVPGAGPLVIEKRKTNLVPSERFGDFLDILATELEEGRLDKELEAAHGAADIDGEGGATIAKTPRAARKPRDPNAPAKPGWTDERRAKFAETVAARKAAKG